MSHRVLFWAVLVFSTTAPGSGLAVVGLLCGSPIVADVSAQVSYCSFSSMTMGQTWRVIDQLPYWSIPLDPPEGYYDSVTTTSSEELGLTLYALIAGHCVLGYSSSASRSTWPNPADTDVDLWDVLALADASPTDPTRVIDIYANYPFPRQTHGTSSGFFYDREHSWPKSYGFDSEALSNPAYSDCHHIFPALKAYNSSRGSCPFASRLTETNVLWQTLAYLGRGGVDEQANARFIRTEGSESRCLWQVWCGRRGDIARALFYMAVRYQGGLDCQDCNGRKVSEPDLRLTDDILAIVANPAAWASGSTAYMGLLSDLLAWHAEDPPDDFERRRNTVIFLFQGNRNPFVDNPQWVSVLFGNACTTNVNPEDRRSASDHVAPQGDRGGMKAADHVIAAIEPDNGVRSCLATFCEDKR